MAEEKKSVGYQDTPQIPCQPYCVHDGERPQPRVVTPGTVSTPGQAGAPPSDAVVLFDGVDTAKWKAKKDGVEGFPWKVENGYMEVIPDSGNIVTKVEFGDCQLHVEWMSPAAVSGNSQGRGNSGIFLMGRYEIQVLDCFDNLTYPDGTTGAIYGQWPPLVNACRKPGEWQQYDIVFVAPRFDGRRMLSPGRVTVLLNGVLLHHNKEIIGPTTHRKLPTFVTHPPIGPMELQDHKNPVRFRNIWYRPLTEYDQG